MDILEGAYCCFSGWLGLFYTIRPCLFPVLNTKTLIKYFVFPPMAPFLGEETHFSGRRTLLLLHSGARVQSGLRYKRADVLVQTLKKFESYLQFIHGKIFAFFCSFEN
jgi:hypothetical protein